MVNVTIKARKDTLSNWQTFNPVLSDGEVAVVEIPATDSTPAICLIKIGDGKTNFNTLQYMQSPAADVYAWAKKATKPEYDYSEIKNLTTMIVAGNNVTATTKDNKVTIATTQNVAKIPGTLPDIGDIEALPVWNSDEGWKRVDADALNATANTIVKRNASGQIVTASPTANTHAVNKKYVDGLVSDNKIARLTDTSKKYVVPCWRGTQWTQYPLTEASIASYSIVQRTSLGQVRVGTPTEDNMATPKSYVDAAVAAISTGGGSSKKLLRFDGNTTAYFDHVATSAYQYTFHLRGMNAMNDGNVKITAGGTTLFSITPDGLAQGEIGVDGTLMFYPASSSSSETQHYVTYSYTASDGTCGSGHIQPTTDMRVTFTGATGAPASGLYYNWVIQEKMDCENWEGYSS